MTETKDGDGSVYVHYVRAHHSCGVEDFGSLPLPAVAARQAKAEKLYMSLSIEKNWTDILQRVAQ